MASFVLYFLLPTGTQYQITWFHMCSQYGARGGNCLCLIGGTLKWMCCICNWWKRDSVCALAQSYHTCAPERLQMTIICAYYTPFKPLTCQICQYFLVNIETKAWFSATRPGNRSHLFYRCWGLHGQQCIQHISIFTQSIWYNLASYNNDNYITSAK